MQRCNRGMSSPRSTAPRSQVSRGDLLARRLPRSTWAPTTAACWLRRRPATGSACSTASAGSCGWARGCTAPVTLSPVGDGARDRRAARLRGAAGAPAGAQAARDRHRGLPACRQRHGVPRPGEARDRPGHRRDLLPRGSGTGARKLRATARRLADGAHCCSTSAADRPSSPGCGPTRAGGPN